MRTQICLLASVAILISSTPLLAEEAKPPAAETNYSALTAEQQQKARDKILKMRKIDGVIDGVRFNKCWT